MEAVYSENVSSPRTSALFMILCAFFGWLAYRRLQNHPAGETLAIVYLLLAAMFLFYVLNYHTLHIRINMEKVTLRFGLFTRHIPIHTISTVTIDSESLWRIGGAGIHFSWFQRRYRAMFNFLQYPRVVLQLSRKRGPVQDVAFTTRNPAAVMETIRSFREQKTGTQPETPAI